MFSPSVCVTQPFVTIAWQPAKEYTLTSGCMRRAGGDIISFASVSHRRAIFPFHSSHPVLPTSGSSSLSLHPCSEPSPSAVLSTANWAALGHKEQQAGNYSLRSETQMKWLSAQVGWHRELCYIYINFIMSWINNSCSCYITRLMTGPFKKAAWVHYHAVLFRFCTSSFKKNVNGIKQWIIINMPWIKMKYVKIDPLLVKEQLGDTFWLMNFHDVSNRLQFMIIIYKNCFIEFAPTKSDF